MVQSFNKIGLAYNQIFIMNLGNLLFLGFKLDIDCMNSRFLAPNKQNPTN
jgi:hypothetical protein